MIVISKEFAEKNNGYSKGNSTFSFAITNKGTCVTDDNSKNEFPELFENFIFDKADFLPSDFQPDYTPPASNGYAIVIPQDFQWVFPVKIEGYTIPMFDFTGKKVVEASYLQWKQAFDAFDKTQNSDYKNAMMKIFIYAKTNPEIIALK